MAITYQSIESNTANSGTTVVVTKPVGLAVGDVMIASAILGNTGGIDLPSGFSIEETMLVGGNRRISTGYKVATSGDVAASNFTFTTGSINQASASLVHFSTDLSFPANPILSSVTGYTINLSSGPASSYLIASVFVSGNRNSSDQASSPARTWTEIRDHANSTLSTSIATAPNTTAETISNFSVTLSGSGINDVVFMILTEQQSPLTTISHLDTLPTVQGLVGSNNVAADVPHLAVEPTINGVSSRVNNPIWTPQVKTATTWTPEIK